MMLIILHNLGVVLFNDSLVILGQGQNPKQQRYCATDLTQHPHSALGLAALAAHLFDCCLVVCDALHLVAKHTECKQAEDDREQDHQGQMDSKLKHRQNMLVRTRLLHCRRNICLHSNWILLLGFGKREDYDEDGV